MNQNLDPKIPSFMFNDIDSYDIKNDRKNISFIDETNVHPTLLN
jgi:hypothetical protein